MSLVYCVCFVFCRSTDVYNVMVFSGKQCWRRNVTAAAAARRRRARTRSRRVPITRTTNRWTWSVAETRTRRYPATTTTITTITTNPTNPVSRRCRAGASFTPALDFPPSRLLKRRRARCVRFRFTGSWFSGLADGSLLLEDAMRRRLAGHPALHHAAFLQHHHNQQQAAHQQQDIDSEQESSCSESGRDRTNSPRSDKESAGPSGKT